MQAMNHQKGFTLLEIIVALALATIISTAGYAFYTTQYQTKLQQERVAFMQQNLRAGMEMLSKDIRRAGYDPLGNTNAGFSEAKGDRLTFSYALDAGHNGIDDDGDGNIDEADEALLVSSISYTLSDANGDEHNDLVRTSGTTTVIATERVEGLELRYRMESGTISTSPGALDEITAVEVALLVKSPRAEKGFKNTITYRGFSQTWGPFDDSFRRRLLRGTIQCRNQGLSL